MIISLRAHFESQFLNVDFVKHRNVIGKSTKTDTSWANSERRRDDDYQGRIILKNVLKVCCPTVNEINHVFFFTCVDDLDHNIRIGREELTVCQHVSIFAHCVSVCTYAKYFPNKSFSSI